MSKYEARLPLAEAAKALSIPAEVLNDWLLENSAKIEARSKLDEKYHQVKKESYTRLLNGEKSIRFVVFKYPKEYDRHRKDKNGKIRRSDAQTLTLKDLRISTEEIKRIRERLPDLSDLYEVKKVRKAGQHWTDLKQVFITAANELLEEDPKKYQTKRGHIIRSKLAKALDENRNRWPALKDEPYGTSYRNIEEKLNEMKDKLIVPVIQKK